MFGANSDKASFTLTYMYMYMSHWHNTQCPHTYITLTQFEDNNGRKLPLKITCRGAVGFEKLVKQATKIFFEKKKDFSM